MKRPVLNEMSLDEARNGLFQGTSPVNIITMDPGQWDTLLQAAYDRGWILLEVRNEMPVRAFRRLKT